MVTFLINVYFSVGWRVNCDILL